jgi:hypothetical protein
MGTFLVRNINLRIKSLHIINQIVHNKKDRFRGQLPERVVLLLETIDQLKNNGI